MDWMSPMDASFLHIEGPNNPMHIGAASIFEGPSPPFEELERMVASKLALVPRYRQKVRFVPLGLGDYDSSDDMDVLTAGVKRAMKELLAATPKRRRTTQVGGSSRARASAPRA